MGDVVKRYKALVALSEPLFELTNDDGQLWLRDKKLELVTEVIDLLFHDVLANAGAYDDTALKPMTIKVDKKQEQAWQYYNNVLIQIVITSQIDMLIMSDQFNLVTKVLQDHSVWDLPMFDKARKDIKDEIYRARYKPKGVKGVGKCNRCGSEELYYQEKQVRSADEPASLFFTCIACDNKWRVG